MRCGRKVMRLWTNRRSCCLPLHMAVRLIPAVDSVQIWTCYSCYVIVESVWSEVVFVRCVTKMDRQKFERRCAITFCVKLGESTTVTYEKLQRAYEEHSLCRAQVFRWHKSFLEGWEQVEDEPCAGRPSPSKTEDNRERVGSLVRSDRRLTLRMIRKSLKDSGKGWHVCNQVMHALGCCTTTMPHVTQQSPSTNFWQKKAFLWFLSPPICRISVPVTSFCSPSSTTTWKDAILVLWITSRKV